FPFLARSHQDPSGGAAPRGATVKHWLRFRNWPLRVKVLAGLFVAAVLPLPVIAWVTFGHMQSQEIENTNAPLLERRDEIPLRLQRTHFFFGNWARGMAGLRAVKEYLRDSPGQPGPSADDVRQTLKAFWDEKVLKLRGLGLLDPAGRLLL